MTTYCVAVSLELRNPFTFELKSDTPVTPADGNVYADFVFTPFSFFQL